MCRSCYIARFSCMSEHVGFKTLSDRYTNSRMVPFLTHTDRVRPNLFSIIKIHLQYFAIIKLSIIAQECTVK